MPESYLVNGVNLMNLAWRIEDASGATTAPGRRGGNITVARRHGAVKGRKRYEPGQFILDMWVKGVDKTTGGLPIGSTDVDEFHKRIDELTRLFYSDTLTIVHVRPDGTQRQAIAELEMEPLAFARDVTSPVYGKFTVALSIPGAFWTDVSPVTQTLAGTSGATLSWTSFAGATAPMDELTLTFGPSNNPQLLQGSTGMLTAYDSTILAGRRLVVDAANWTITGAVDAGGNWSYNYAAFRHLNSARWFELTPNYDGSAPVTTLSHTGGGSVSVTLSGRRKYLTP
jgi:hypothetical protein